MLLDPAAALRGLCAALTAALDRAASLAPDAAAAAGFGGFAALVSAVAPAARVSDWGPGGARLPVAGLWRTALDAAEDGAASPCVPSLRALGPHLRWTQNPHYRRQPPDPRFLESYGYAVLVGPPGDPPPHIASSRLALGVLLLGPDTHYPSHHHPAEEVYAVVSGHGEWWRGDGPWRREPPGALIHHAPNVRHATRAGARPLLALYLWRGDLATHARLSAAPP
jgi:mannose-6-phosphate isomerase-like protein (cupin superfamily)